MPFKDPEKRRASQRRYYEKNRQAVIAAAAARHARLKDEPTYRRQIIEARTRYRRRQGALPREEYVARRRARLLLLREKRVAEAEAIREWRRWLRVAPPEWRARYWANHPKPWRDPQLSVAERYVLRYRKDRGFRVREYARLQAKKRRDRTLMRTLAVDVTEADAVAMRAAASHCIYCGRELGKDRTLDHVVPLSRGGAHAKRNLVPACRSCNSSKQDKDLSQWAAGVPHG